MQKYLETIQECVFPFAEEIGLFQQDNAPPHKTQVVLKSLEDAHITVMNWPPYSSDLNCIENMWKILKDKVHLQHLTNLDQLSNAVQNIWHTDPEIKSVCETLVNSMPKRIKEVCRVRGAAIGY